MRALPHVHARWPVSCELTCACLSWQWYILHDVCVCMCVCVHCRLEPSQRLSGHGACVARGSEETCVHLQTADYRHTRGKCARAHTHTHTSLPSLETSHSMHAQQTDAHTHTQMLVPTQWYLRVPLCVCVQVYQRQLMKQGLSKSIVDDNVIKGQFSLDELKSLFKV